MSYLQHTPLLVYSNYTEAAPERAQNKNYVLINTVVKDMVLLMSQTYASHCKYTYIIL